MTEENVQSIVSETSETKITPISVTYETNIQAAAEVVSVEVVDKDIPQHAAERLSEGEEDGNSGRNILTLSNISITQEPPSNIYEVAVSDKTDQSKSILQEELSSTRSRPLKKPIPTPR
jgi:hypothetical protein